MGKANVCLVMLALMLIVAAACTNLSAAPMTAYPGGNLRMTPTPPGSSGQPIIITAIVDTTASAVVTVIAAPGTTLYPTSTPPPPLTPLPVSTSPEALSPTYLRYRLIDAFGGEVFYCTCAGPAGGKCIGNPQAAVEWLYSPDGLGSEEAQVILQRLGIDDPRQLSPEQVLLVYGEHWKLLHVGLDPQGDAYQFVLPAQTADGVWTIQGTIGPRGDIAIAHQRFFPGWPPCPICLSGSTLIDTPSGPVPVRDFRVGMRVWTVDANRERVVATITRTSRVAVPSEQSMVHLYLNDGRELLVSPGHPTADGRWLGNLQVGDWLDGAQVMQIERVPLHDDATYDILPSGDTGYYWANGILIGSTLSQP